MKNVIAFLSMLILFLPIASAETQIFSGTIITDQDKAIDGTIFRFTYDEASNKVFVQNPVQSLIIENGDCKSNNVFRVCINSANYSDRNITTYVTYYQVDTTIYKLTGSLSIVSTATSSNLLQGEPANVTITINNPTDFDINNIEYEENLTGFAVLSVDGCTLSGNKILWSGSLQSKYNKVCTAEIIAEQEGTYNLVGNLRYFNGFETENKATDTLTITVLPQQLVINQLVDDDVELHQPFYFNVTLQNINQNEKIELSIIIDIPQNFELLNKISNFAKDVNVLKSTARLESGSTFNYSLYLKGNAESKIPIEQRFDYAIKGISYTTKNYTFVNPLEPKPIINFSTEYNEITSGEKFIVIIRIRNPSKIYELTDIKARLTAPYNNDIEQNLNKLMPDELYSIISNTLVAPKDLLEGTKTSSIKLNLEVEYAFGGIAKSINKSLELKVKLANITISNATTKENIQSPAAGINQTPSNESQLGNKTSKTAAQAEKPKSRLFNKENLIIVASVFSILLVVTFIIAKIRKRKKGSEELKEKVVKDVEDVMNEPKNF